MCISNGRQSAKKETNMNKINGSAKMNKSAENSATAHTLIHYGHIINKKKYDYTY